MSKRGTHTTKCPIQGCSESPYIYYQYNVSKSWNSKCSSHSGPMFYVKHPGNRPCAFGRKIVAYMLRYLLQWIIVVHRNPKLEQLVSFHCICVYCNFVCSKRIFCLQKTSLTGLVEFLISSIMCFCEINNKKDQFILDWCLGEAYANVKNDLTALEAQHAGFFFHCHYHFLKLAKPNCNTEWKWRRWWTQDYRILVTMLGSNNGEENLNFPWITFS